MVSNAQVKSQENPEVWQMQPIDIVRGILVCRAKAVFV